MHAPPMHAPPMHAPPMGSRPFRSPLAGVISPANPMGTDGFEFLEFTGPDIAALETAFRG
ncbi:MAG: hypothetical protein IT556_00615, partial [Acetobacteraceae bacterium]|nr:hypothetical protein [Acetobacteraceae bacterium]